MVNVVAHLIPYDTTGGVETAAKTIDRCSCKRVNFHRIYLANKRGVKNDHKNYHGPYFSENNPLNYLAAVLKVLQLKPEILIVSLWRSCFVGIAVKLLRPSTRLVSFIHSSSSSHPIDAILNRIVIGLSYETWADSNSTLRARVPPRLLGRSRVISFVLDRVDITRQMDLVPRFIFWGRVHKKKGLDRAINIFSLVHRKFPEATFTIVGPDGGARGALEEHCLKIGLANVVRFTGDSNRDEIVSQALSHSFYLQTSLKEGMAMAVIEAMQLGLVPIVTPVGEIANYCRDGENSIVVEDDEGAACKIAALLAQPLDYIRLRAAAQAEWLNRPLYHEDVLAACRKILRIL